MIGMVPLIMGDPKRDNGCNVVLPNTVAPDAVGTLPVQLLLSVS